MRQPDTATRRYLECHAEVEAARAETVSSHHGHVLTVPVYDEGDSFFTLLSSVPSGPLGSVLVVAVVNARDDSGADVVERNRQLQSRLRDDFPDMKTPGDNAVLHTTPFGALLCLDRSSRERLPRKRGVGLARKIAGDLALALRASGKIASRWIHFTDADAVLPADYFGRLDGRDPLDGLDGLDQLDALESDGTAGIRAGGRKGDPRTVAVIYPFRHHSSSVPLQRAGVSHEMFMRHYVLGLQSAGSPYAYHSIGSLIAVDATAYAEVRGVPRRHGAEDFYLLNKLAKLGAIGRLSGSPIELEARASQRVPFGTGPAIRRALESSDPPRNFYHPECFHYLAALFATVERALSGGASIASTALLREEGARRGLDARRTEEMADFLKLETRLRESTARSTRHATRLRDWHTHFDALRTLQLLHWLRDRGLPNSDWQGAMSSLGLAVDREPETVLAELIALEQRLCTTPRGLGI